MYLYALGTLKTSSVVDDFGNLYPLTTKGIDCIFRGTYAVGY